MPTGEEAGNLFGTLTLNDSASVTGTAAGTEGGGILTVEGCRVCVCSDQVVISPNDPDDPSEALVCT